MGCENKISQLDCGISFSPAVPLVGRVRVRQAGGLDMQGKGYIDGCDF